MAANEDANAGSNSLYKWWKLFHENLERGNETSKNGPDFLVSVIFLPFLNVSDFFFSFCSSGEFTVCYRKSCMRPNNN